MIVASPHASVAVAFPASGTPVGLQPRSEPSGQKVNDGGVVSTVHVNTCVHVELFPHPSVAVYVLVCARRHPSEWIDPSADVIVGVPQASVAVAAPGPGTPAGLHPSSSPCGQNVNDGGASSKMLIETIQWCTTGAITLLNTVTV